MVYVKRRGRRMRARLPTTRPRARRPTRAAPSRGVLRSGCSARRLTGTCAASAIPVRAQKRRGAAAGPRGGTKSAVAGSGARLAVAPACSTVAPQTQQLDAPAARSTEAASSFFLRLTHIIGDMKRKILFSETEATPEEIGRRVWYA